jgi:hypothetical protein
MSWFLLSALVFGFWGVTFLFFPTLSNEFGGIGFNGSQHAKDWTQLVGLFSFASAYLLGATHRSQIDDLRRVVARGMLVVTLPSAGLMTYWQLIPDRQWLRLDLLNIALLLLMSYGLYTQSNLVLRRRPTLSGA